MFKTFIKYYLAGLIGGIIGMAVSVLMLLSIRQIYILIGISGIGLGLLNFCISGIVSFIVVYKLMKHILSN